MSTQSAKTTQPVLKVQGGTPLRGEVEISGAKNAALVLMAAALLCADECKIDNVPHLQDVAAMGDILTALGAKLEHRQTVLTLDTRDLTQTSAPVQLASKLRAGFFLIGAMLARFGVAEMPLPGGCAIGARPVDEHLRGLEAMGAKIECDQGIVRAHLQQGQRLQGARILLSCPSVGATETLLMAATLAEGVTIIENAAREPEVLDLANFCRSMGAQIRGAGTSTIVISGVSHLHGTEYRTMSDRIEAGTFLLASAMTRSPLVLTSVHFPHLGSVIQTLWAMGATFTVESVNRLRIDPPTDPRTRIIKTRPYPGFPTDMQPQFMALLSLAAGNSLVIESLFENRLQHAAELNRMGANIRVQGNCALIAGVSHLTGTVVKATDLRASAALVLAGLAAEGTTTIYNLHHLDRGYENFDLKLRQLGADIQRVYVPGTLLSDPFFTATSAIKPLQRDSGQSITPEVA